jgi:DNA-binding MarR family transcriptional regulator
VALERGESLPLVTIASRERVTVSAVRKVVAQLETEGLVERVRDAEDMRLVRVQATREGVGLAHQIRTVRSAALAPVLRELKPDQLLTLISAARLCEGLADRIVRRREGPWWS